MRLSGQFRILYCKLEIILKYLSGKLEIIGKNIDSFKPSEIFWLKWKYLDFLWSRQFWNVPEYLKLSGNIWAVLKMPCKFEIHLWYVRNKPLLIDYQILSIAIALSFVLLVVQIVPKWSTMATTDQPADSKVARKKSQRMQRWRGVWLRWPVEHR